MKLGVIASIGRSDTFVQKHENRIDTIVQSLSSKSSFCANGGQQISNNPLQLYLRVCFFPEKCRKTCLAIGGS